MKIECYSPGIKRKEMDAVLTVLVDEKIGPGEQAERLLALAKERLGFDYALALRSPAIALYIALKALDLPAGSKAAVSALCPPYYAAVFNALGVVPLYCDTEDGTVCIGAKTVLSAQEKCTGGPARAIIVSETLGFMPEMPALLEMGLPVIEDASAAYGGMLGEKAAGSFGVFTILGLEERDMLTGGGGALLFSMEKRNAAVLRNFSGLEPEFGLADMNAAMAIAQLRDSGKNSVRRKEIAEMYTQSALRGRHKLPALPDGFVYNNYAFPLILETGMKDVQTYAKRKEIVVEPAFARTPAALGFVEAQAVPESYSLSLRTALFPLYPRLNAASIERVAKLLQTLP
ncbi:MAG: DegT/DnrJ/EryC1/StrS family aminotransferase [Spirochaetaceae bacterium]|nr:DegT/DnrJ/EryC1/StrS family aminotransferase [Spirochaetaceae bacterium]